MRLSLSTLVSSTALAATALATPIATKLDKRADFVKRTDDLVWKGNSTLPKVLVYTDYATAASGSTNAVTDTSAYGQITRNASEVLEAIPEVYDVAQIAVKYITSGIRGGINTGSYDYLALSLAKYVDYALCHEGSDIDGAVFIHGTNLLEETAFLADVTVSCDKPVVATGSMRPFTDVGYEGNANIYSAFTLAVAPDAAGRGTMIAFNDRIVPAHWAMKFNGNTPDAFKAYEQGNLGMFVNHMPIFYSTPSLPAGKTVFPIQHIEELPKVDILYVHREQDIRLLNASVALGAQGVVFDGTGSGAITRDDGSVADFVAQGIQVVTATRTPTGMSVPSLSSAPNHAQSGFLVANGYNMTNTIKLFEGHIRQSLGPGYTLA
ncbi:hypothetical protein Rhopal_004986-T1 [Rhodotorula paludigena]|uniref:asparaginase n=1 Tax=Rhodotorula paludigena TaxID=86838 RepID=A0AAV5GTL2_9BASI|nr:hypothetical protein Rhopal_004986-T1 [Rhodotorula paludigena]